jgi:hypothetical protein
VQSVNERRSVASVDTTAPYWWAFTVL